LDVFGLFGGIGLVGRRGTGRRLLEAEDELVRLLVERDLDDAALDELAEEQLLGQRLLHMLLDDAAQRPCAEKLVVAFDAEPLARLVVEDDLHIARSASDNPAASARNKSNVLLFPQGSPGRNFKHRHLHYARRFCRATRI